MSTDNGLNRREFAKVVTAGTLGGSLAAAVDAGAAEAPIAHEPPVEAPKPNDLKAPPPEKKLDAASLLTDVVRARYPRTSFEKSVLQEIRSDIAGDMYRSVVLSSYPLKNSDEPGFVFAAYRDDA